jgi:hypothetical protein
MLFDNGREAVVLSEFYGRQDHKLIIFMNMRRECSTCCK